MTISDAQFTKWCREDHEREILLQQDYRYQVGVSTSAVPTTGTLRFSRFGYVDESTSPPTRYWARIKDVAEYERGLDPSTLRGQYNVSVGTTVLANSDRWLDFMLDLALDGSDHRVYAGDPSWPITDFRLCYTAKSLRVGATYPQDGPATMGIELRDPAVMLNRSIGGMVAVGGTGPSANQFRGLNFGFVHQYKPIPITTQQYAYNDTGTNASAPAVRSNGNLFTSGTDYTVNADGTFTLTVSPTAQEEITCDVLVHAAASVVSYRASDAFDYLIGGRGGLVTAGAYLGAGTMYEFRGANDYHVGISITDATNLIEIANRICDTTNGFWAFDRTGKFYYSWMRPEALSYFLAGASGGAAPTLDAELKLDDFLGPLVIEHNLPRYSSYQAYGNINWTKQNTFSSALSATARERFERDGYRTAHFAGEEVTTAYRGDTVSWKGGAPERYHLTLSDSQIISTLIAGPDDTTIIDAAALSPQSVENYLQRYVAVRRAENLPWVERVSGPVGMDRFALEIGSIVNLTHPDAGLSGGRLHQVYRIRISPMKWRVDLGIVRRRFADVAVAPNTGVGYLLQEGGGKILQEGGGGILIT